jgi:hypothetical protein
MRSTRRSLWLFGRPVSFTFLLLLTLLTTTLVARAADDEEEGDEYDVKARVVRISLITGDVTLKRAGNTDWERAKLNFALVEGDTISTGSNDTQSRVEIQIDARNFVRLGSNSMLKIVTLRDEGVALGVAEGTVTVRLAKFDREHEYFEVDAPKSTLSAEKTGLYRVDVSREGRVRLSARDGGRARIYSETSGFALRDGRTAELMYEGADAGDWEFVATNAADPWDLWVSEREHYLAERLRYDTQYYDQYVWGAEDLDAYGNWTYTTDYGWIWHPHQSAVNGYHDWAPYRYGTWCWVSPYGWTWVGYEPWGWAPYHYGRWVYYNNYWAWCPRSHYYRHRSWWRPALVAFNIWFGNNVCWYPLHYHQRDPHSRYYHNDRLRPLRGDELARLQRVNPAYYRAVTALPAKDFGADGARLRRADDALARRAINAEPLRTDLPVRPAYAAGERTAAADRTVTAARPARVAAPRDLNDRPTGAAARTPGAELDSELRRTRVLNGREGVIARPDSQAPITGASGPLETRPTGAVARPPSRPVRETEPASEGSRDANRVPAAAERPARTEDRIPRESREPRDNNLPAQPQVNEPERPLRVPERPERSEPPANVERPERHERPQAPARTESPRSEPAPRYEPPVRNDPPPRNDPPARSEPPTRHDPPARSEPSRSEPSHSEPSRSEPSHSEPSRSEPSHSEPSRSEPSRPDPPSRSDSGGDRSPSKVRDPR